MYDTEFIIYVPHYQLINVINNNCDSIDNNYDITSHDIGNGISILMDTYESESDTADTDPYY